MVTLAMDFPDKGRVIADAARHGRELTEAGAAFKVWRIAKRVPVSFINLKVHEIQRKAGDPTLMRSSAILEWEIGRGDLTVREQELIKLVINAIAPDELPWWVD